MKKVTIVDDDLFEAKLTLKHYKDGEVNISISHNDGRWTWINIDRESLKKALEKIAL